MNFHLFTPGLGACVPLAVTYWLLGGLLRWAQGRRAQPMTALQCPRRVVGDEWSEMTEAAQRWWHAVARNPLLQKRDTACDVLRNRFVQIAMELGKRLSFPGRLTVELDEELAVGNQLLLGVFRRWHVVGLGVFFRHPAHLGYLISQGGGLPLIPMRESGVIVPQDEIVRRTGRAADRYCQQRGTNPSARPKGPHKLHPLCRGGIIR